MSRRAQHPNPENSPAPVLLIQMIRTTWSKASRGGTAAALRNAVPETCRLPHLLPRSQPITVIHTVQFAEINQFAVPTHTDVTITVGIDKVRLDSIALYPSEDTIRVAAEWLLLAGAPRRRPISNLLELSAQHWVQIRYNLRSGLDDAWRYYKYVFNVGVFTGVSPEAFTTTAPTMIKSFLADLW
jgi:hypothetical protein